MATIAMPRNSTIVRNMGLLALRARYRVGSWLAPNRTLHDAYRLFSTPLSSARPRAQAAGDGGAAVSSLPFQGEQIGLYVWGDPAAQPYVLLAHGWSSFGLRFQGWLPRLREAGFAAVAFDQVGHGRSSGRRSTLPGFAEVLHAVAARFGRAHAVIGHSLGGAATMVAMADGLAADRAVLIAPAADPVAAAQRFARLVGLADKLAARLFDEYEATHPTRVASLHAHVAAPRIGRPALIVHDLADREVPWAEGERYARYWPDARLLTTQGLGHHRIVDDTAVIDAALRFLQGGVVGERVVSTCDLPFGLA